jgi:glycosyltransferase involved in cell wall biosynthesis
VRTFRAVAKPIWILDDAQIDGGGQRFALRLGQHLVAAGRPVSVLTPGSGTLVRMCRAAGVPTLDASFPALVPAALPALAKAAWSLRRLLRTAPRGTLVVANSGRTLVVARAARARRLVLLMHERESADRRAALAFLRTAPAIVTVGENTAEVYGARLGRDVVTVNNFLAEADLRRLAEEARSRERAHPPVVGVLARMMPVKGVADAVKELTAVPEAWSRLDIGAGEQDAAYSAAVRELAAAAPHEVRLLGHVTDIDGFFAAIDVLVIPSWREGQPTVLIEALARGVPVVMREGLYETAFGGLPVRAYATPEELAVAIALEPSRAPADELVRRFAPGQVVEGLERAAGPA